MSRWGTAEQRFWSQVEKTDTCWNWVGVAHNKGYGRLKVNGIKTLAHRYSWELAKGPLPEGVFLDHECRNRACVNPDHLRQVTNKQNMENLASASTRNSSGIRGVSWHRKTRKWKAAARHNGQDYYFGLFGSLEDAAKAVQEGRNRLFTHNEEDRKAA